MARTVLVEDDNPVIRKLLCQTFEAEEDYDLCEQATNGREAIDLAATCRPELIILDFSMPVMNGLDAARELKKLMPRVPIILFTQYTHLGNRLSPNEMYFDRIVSKDNGADLMEVRSLLPG